MDFDFVFYFDPNGTHIWIRTHFCLSVCKNILIKSVIIIIILNCQLIFFNNDIVQYEEIKQKNGEKKWWTNGQFIHSENFLFCSTIIITQTHLLHSYNGNKCLTSVFGQFAPKKIWWTRLPTIKFMMNEDITIHFTYGSNKIK